MSNTAHGGDITDSSHTPETVLRAMLRAYQAETIDAHLRFAAAWIVDTKELSPDTAAYRARWEDLQNCCDDIERELVFSVAYHQPVDLFSSKRLLIDYDARMRGERPIDAPPMAYHASGDKS